MSSKLDQLTGWLKEHKITEVECLISDLTGIARGKIAPTNKFIAEIEKNGELSAINKRWFGVELTKLPPMPQF